jgi:hypothetical protein
MSDPGLDSGRKRKLEEEEDDEEEEEETTRKKPSGENAVIFSDAYLDTVGVLYLSRDSPERVSELDLCPTLNWNRSTAKCWILISRKSAPSLYRTSMSTPVLFVANTSKVRCFSRSVPEPGTELLPLQAEGCHHTPTFIAYTTITMFLSTYRP